MSSRDSAARAGRAAADALTAAERTILAAMAANADLVAGGTLTPQLARKRVDRTATIALGQASRALRQVYARAVRDVTGGDGPLPDAPGQVAGAVLRAQQDAGVAFGAVLAAAAGLGNGVRMPPRSSPYRRVVTSAQRQGTPARAAAAALGQIAGRGLTGWTSYQGRRQSLAAYGQRVVTAAAVHLARMPVLSEVTARRDTLLTGHARAVTAAWDIATAYLEPSELVTAYLADSRVTSTAPDPAVARRWQQEAATAAATSWLAGIDLAAAYGHHLILSLQAMARDGMAEGEADAMAFASQKQRLAGFSIDAAYTAAVARLDGDLAVSRQARDAAAGITGSAAKAVARALPAASQDGREAMERAAEAALRDIVARGADWALWSALGAGAIALYQRAAAQQFTGQGLLLDWNISASACPVCQQNAAGSPYALADLPAYPAHGACRCWISADGDLPLSMLAPFLS